MSTTWLSLRALCTIHCWAMLGQPMVSFNTSKACVFSRGHCSLVWLLAIQAIDARSLFCNIWKGIPSKACTCWYFFASCGDTAFVCLSFLYCKPFKVCACTTWCSEIGSLTSLDACNSGASCDVRQPISLHHVVQCWMAAIHDMRPCSQVVMPGDEW